MNEVDIRIYVEAKLREHGLWQQGWRFMFDRATVRFGSCRHGEKRVTVSRPLSQINCDEEIKDTVLHEIAHALCPPDEGHGRLWKATAKRIGARPVRCHSAKTARPYALECPRCGQLKTSTRSNCVHASCWLCQGKPVYLREVKTGRKWEIVYELVPTHLIYGGETRPNSLTGRWRFRDETGRLFERRWSREKRSAIFREVEE